MHDISTLELGKSVLEANRKLAEDNHRILMEAGVRSFDFMGAIGSGKTELIIRLARGLMDRGKGVGVITGDVAGEDDYKRVKGAGIEAVANINTGKDCHLDAHRVEHVLDTILKHDIDVLFVENVGNLVCPADFPLGTDMRLVVVSVTEGDDMVRKHPVIFGLADIAVVNKMDLAEYVGVSLETIKADYMKLKAGGRMVITDAKRGVGVEELAHEMGLW